MTSGSVTSSCQRATEARAPRPLPFPGLVVLCRLRGIRHLLVLPLPHPLPLPRTSIQPPSLPHPTLTAPYVLCKVCLPQSFRRSRSPQFLLFPAMYLRRVERYGVLGAVVGDDSTGDALISTRSSIVAYRFHPFPFPVPPPVRCVRRVFGTVRWR